MPHLDIVVRKLRIVRTDSDIHAGDLLIRVAFTNLHATGSVVPVSLLYIVMQWQSIHAPVLYIVAAGFVVRVCYFPVRAAVQGIRLADLDIVLFWMSGGGWKMMMQLCRGEVLLSGRMAGVSKRYLFGKSCIYSIYIILPAQTLL